MKKFYVNLGIYLERVILDIHIIIYAETAEVAKAAAENLYPKARIYYASEDDPLNA